MREIPANVSLALCVCVVFCYQLVFTPGDISVCEEEYDAHFILTYRTLSVDQVTTDANKGGFIQTQNTTIGQSSI